MRVVEGKTIHRAKEAGAKAFKKRIPHNKNPYIKKAKAWGQGWLQAERAWAAKVVESSLCRKFDSTKK